MYMPPAIRSAKCFLGHEIELSRLSGGVRVFGVSGVARIVRTTTLKKP